MIITSTKKKKKDEDIAPVLSKETKQAIKSTVSQKAKDIVNASPIGKIKNTFSDGYQVGDVTKTILNVGNMLNPISMVKDKASEIGSTIGTSIKNNKGNFVKSTKSKEKIKNIWDDGYQLGDVSKTFFNIEKSVLGTAGDVAANLAKGELQTAEGLVDTGRYLLSDITKYTNPALSLRARRNAIQNTTGVILGENDMYNQPKENGWAKKLDEYSISGNALDNIIQSVGQQAFRVGLQGAVGMTGASEGATAAFNKLEIFAGSYGSSKSQALMNGADDTTATIKGFIGGTSEYISENLFDSIPGFKTGELKGITKVKDLIGKSAEKTFGKTAGKAMIRVFSALGEGTEERLSNGLETALTDIVNAINPSYAYGMEEGQGLTESTFGKNALKLFQDTFKSAFSKESNEAFVSAFFSTLITGAIADTMTNAERNQVIKAYAKDNNITTEQATKLFDSIRDLRLQQIVDNNTDYEQRSNIEDNLTKQLSQEIKTNKDLNLQDLQEGLIARDKFTKAVGTGVVSSRGLDLVESYKAYNGDTKYKNEIANIQKFMNNRNIDARFDATMFDNNEQNAIWTTENGKDSVVFNPNATQEQVIQSIATHEMTHDIINQKTEAGTSLFNDVLENIKTQKDYAKNRQEIEDLYAKYYDRNSKDFAAKVDEEMVANELGKNLGTQEYINRLVNEKPNLAKRIYNWVVDKLDNIGKSEEYKEQKAYWKSVADKFEKAYNEQKTATGEDKTAYSILKNKKEYNLGTYQYGLSKTDDSYKYNKVYAYDIENGGKGDNVQVSVTPTGYVWNNALLSDNIKGKGEGTKIALDLNQQSIKETGYPLRSLPEYNVVGTKNHTEEGKGLWESLVRKGYAVKNNDNSYTMLETAPTEQQTTTKYSLTKDSQGRTLSKEQQKYFKDSKIVDKDGNLMEVYHGTYNDFTTFDKSYLGSASGDLGFLGDGFYFATHSGEANYYGNKNMAVYLNVTNPFNIKNLQKYNGMNLRGEQSNPYIEIKNLVDMNPEWADIKIGYGNTYGDVANATDEVLQNISVEYLGKNEDGSKRYKINNGEKFDYVNALNDYSTDELIADEFYREMRSRFGSIDSSEVIQYITSEAQFKKINGDKPIKTFSEVLQDNGYDGIMQDITADRTDEIVVFNSNQIKNVDNTNPTTNPDIRYSLSVSEANTGKDNTGRELSEGQRDYFKDSKVRDSEGNLMVMYHGTESNVGLPENEKFSVFDRDRAGSHGTYYGAGFYFTPNMESAQDYAKSKGDVYQTYLDMKNPYIPTSDTINEDGTVDFAPNFYEDFENRFKDQLPQYWNDENTNKGRVVRNILEDNGYDGVINGDTYVVFNSNQIKNVDNLNPTSNEDIRYSMQQEETPFTKGTRTTMGELFGRDIAPIREDLSNIREQMNNLSNQLETMQESLGNTSESTNRGYVEPFREQRYENESYTPLTEEEADLYQNALLNDEAYKRSVDEQADFEENNTKLINKLTDDVQSRLALDKKQKSTLESIIKDAVDNDLTTDEIVEKLTRQFKQQEEKYTNDEIKEVKKSIKRTAIKVSDGIKKDIADYGDFQRRNLNKITFSRNGLPVDVAYQALQEQQPGYFPDDIINPTDQLLRISDVANMANEIIEKYDVPQDVFEDIADYIKESILDDEYNSQMEREASLDTDIRMNFTEDIAPTTIRSQESIDDFIENRDIAPVREDTPKQRSKSELRDRFDNMRRKFSEMVTNRNYVIDETARATGNNEIKYAGDNLNNVSGETQYNIHNKQTDINGKWVGKGLDELFAPAREAGLADVYNDYLFHKSNIERHNVGKGSEVPLIVSQQLVAKYDTEYPQLKTWIKDLYKFEDNLLQEQVDSGIITQEKYNDYRGEHGIYRSYVPFYPGNIERSRYFDDEGNVRPVSTLKRSKGGAGDVNTMLSMEEAIARQVYASKRAIRQNELYKEMVSSLEKYEDMMDQDVRDNPTNLDDSLYITPDGEYVLSAYFDGEKVSAKISEELYNELAGTNENRIRQIEEDFSLITNPLQKVSNVRRNLLTTWNPTFLARNAIKDIQDAVINSKYTGDMLANYFGTKKGSKSAIMELREAKTETAQQFLALYGADNLYGDYSNVGKSNKLVNKFSRINELIELAPRYAEFKATLENGGTINEAIYNAREVTTNFGRGGYITKALNRNGFTFLNANVQGLNKLIRNLSGENGAKGVTSVVAKGVAFALLPSILNHLLYGTGDDKDEEYDALPDYIKDNYYLIKLESGKFLRIPKGRINAVFGSAARRSIEALEGESDAFKGYGSNAWSQIGVGDLGSNNIFTPLTQAFGSKNGTAWYGGDIVPKRLQNVPAGEQTDASIDAISNFIGKNLGISPYKINYVLDQYSGGIGDVLLPMITEETTSGAENSLEYLTAPIKDSFIVNSTDDNKYAGDFYDTKDKLQVKSNSQYATDEDKLRYKYMSSVSTQLSDLYKERREVQADTTLGNKEKYAKVQAIQNEINSLAKEALNNYKSFSVTDNYSSIGDVEYYKDDEDKWTKVKDNESEFTAGLNDSEKTAYYSTKNKISGITQEYTEKTKDLDKDSPLREKYSAEKKENITRTIINSGLDNYTKAMVYSKYYSDKETMTNVVNAGYDTDTYITALSDIEALRTKYSQKNGYSTAQRKAKTMAYINSIDMNIPQKAMLTRRYYSSFRTYNKDIVNYVSNLDITQDEKVSILKDMGMTVKGNKVSWK